MIPDGYCRQERVSASVFFISVRRDFSRQFSRRFFYFRQERFFPSVVMPSGNVETYPVIDITVREG
jgi:hypothetical protein